MRQRVIPMPRGWPKGKPRGPYGKERMGNLTASRVRASRLKRRREYELASGHTGQGNMNLEFRPNRGVVDTSPAAWKGAGTYVGDYQYVDCGLDEVMVRALHNRVVYASSVCCHREPCFQDLTIDTLAAVEKTARKYGIRPRRVPEPKVFIVPKPKMVMIYGRAAKVVEKAMREGTPLLQVVDEMFPKSREGRYLVEVVSELYDSLKGDI